MKEFKIDEFSRLLKKSVSAFEISFILRWQEKEEDSGRMDVLATNGWTFLQEEIAPVKITAKVMVIIFFMIVYMFI